MQLNINRLLSNVWGYVALPFPEGEINFNPAAGLDTILNRSDALGRPLVMPVSIGGLLLPHAVIAINGKKRIVETALTGSSLRGTFKEQIDVDDYELRIAGVLLGEDDSFPESDVRALRELFERREALAVDCPLTRLFDIEHLVITEFSLPEVRWLPYQAFDLKAASDDDFMVELLMES